MSNTYRRQKRQAIHRKIGKVSKREMVVALVAQRLKSRYPSISYDNLTTTSQFLGFFVWMFSFPYDAVKKLQLKRKFSKASAKIKTQKDK